MSSYTTNLQLFKYNTATDGKQVFSIDDAMNDNWDKIDAFAKAIKDLSNLSSVGEKRFTDINNELSQKLEAQVSLAQNGYIKFNNGITFLWIFISMVNSYYDVTLPIAISSNVRRKNFFICDVNGETATNIVHRPFIFAWCVANSLSTSTTQRIICDKTNSQGVSILGISY